jgi:hypothetical protein
MLHIKAAKYMSGYKLWVAFNDGASGKVDLNGELCSLVFESLMQSMLKAYADLRVY